MSDELEPRPMNELDWRVRGQLHDYGRREALAKGYIRAAANVAKAEAEVRIQDGLELAHGAVEGLARLDRGLERITRGNPGLADVVGRLEDRVLLNIEGLIDKVMRRPPR